MYNQQIWSVHVVGERPLDFLPFTLSCTTSLHLCLSFHNMTKKDEYTLKDCCGKSLMDIEFLHDRIICSISGPGYTKRLIIWPKMMSIHWRIVVEILWWTLNSCMIELFVLSAVQDIQSALRQQYTFVASSLFVLLWCKFQVMLYRPRSISY